MVWNPASAGVLTPHGGGSARARQRNHRHPPALAGLGLAYSKVIVHSPTAVISTNRTLLETTTCPS